MAPVPEPPVKSEEHWSDPEEQQERCSFYGASKTLAERAAYDFVAEDWAPRGPRACEIFCAEDAPGAHFVDLPHHGAGSDAASGREHDHGRLQELAEERRASRQVPERLDELRGRA